VEVTIGKPARTADGDDWACPYFVSGLGMRRVAFARGVDSVQALMLAIEATRIFLEQHMKRVSWPFGDEGDLGFPRVVPYVLGVAFSRKINDMIDRQVDLFIEEKKARLRDLEE
jgi:hypothetical protein